MRQPAPPHSGRFATTRWSLVVAAGDSDHPHFRDALEELCGLYWYPVYAFIRRGGVDSDAAQDLAQGFFSHLLEKRTWRSADPDRGRFRSFLLGALKLFLANERERAMALKRGGGREILSLELSGAEQRYRLERKSGEDPERAFARRWALEVIDRAVSQFREELERSPEPERSLILAARLTGDGGGAPYCTVAAELEMTEGAVRVAVHRMRRRFGAILRQEVTKTVSDPSRIDDELRYLLSCVSP
jgi:RNA polymerase sigma-70 factor (ECF subfamily)